MTGTDEIQALLRWAGGNVLDLRPAEDFAAGHLAGAAPHPLSGPVTGDLLAEELPSIFLP